MTYSSRAITRRVVPMVRLGGFASLFALALLNWWLVEPLIRLAPILWFGAASLAYSLVAVVLLPRLSEAGALALSPRLAELDILLWAFCIYATGGEKSWFLLLMILRPADHITAGHQRVLRFGLVSLASYAAMLAWIAGVDGRAIPWNVEALKLTALLFFNLYIALAARTVDRLQERMRRTRRQLIEARDASVSASAAKSEFLACMSHELRTPLNAIIGYSQLLSEELELLDHQQVRDDLGKIETSGQHLLVLVNQVLDLEKVESGRMKLTVEEFDARLIVDEVVGSAGSLARAKGNRLVSECAADGPVVSLGDPLRFRQSLLNLVANACKFTEQGEVVVRVGSERVEDGQMRTVVSVADTGIGMNSAQVDRLFQPFSQGDSSVGRKYGGTGLGLALTKRFCEMMGGDVTVESRLGAGSTFRIRIPAAQREEP